MGVILPGVKRDGIFPQFFCGSGTGEVWEFTPVSPSSLCVLDPVLWSTSCNSHILTADRFNGQLLEPGLRSWRFVTRPTSNITCRTMRTAVDEVITTHGLLKKLNVHLLLNPKHNSASWLVVFSGRFTCGRGQQAHSPSLVLQHVLPSGQAAVLLQGTSECTETQEKTVQEHKKLSFYTVSVCAGSSALIYLV